MNSRKTLIIGILTVSVALTVTYTADNSDWPEVERIEYWENGSSHTLDNRSDAYTQIKPVLLEAIDSFQVRETAYIGQCRERFNQREVLYLEFVQPVNITRNGYPIITKAFIFPLQGSRIHELSPDGGCSIFRSSFNYSDKLPDTIQ